MRSSGSNLRRLRLAGLLAGLVVALSACTPTQPTPSATSGPTESAEPSALSSQPPLAESPAPSGGPSSSTAIGAPGKLSWKPCGGQFQCSSLTVPLDYSDPSGRTIDLGLIRLPASDPAHRVGSLVVNPGGPGGSGVEFVQNSATSAFSSALRSHFDIVGFDPRGVGQSHPITCLDGPAMDKFIALDPTPDNPTELQAVIDGTKRFDAACDANSGDVLPYLSTNDVARDMDRIREALGESKLTYFGFSYGTFLGTVYAGLFPTHVRALVLDGAVDGTLDFAAQTTQQAEGFEQALDHFFADCASRPTCEFYSNGHPADEFDALMKRIDGHPIPATLLGDPRPVGPGESFTGVTAALYDRGYWDPLAQGLELADRGDGSILLQLSDALTERHPDGSYGSLIPVLNATNCLDYPAPKDLSFYDQLAQKLEKDVPRFGEAFAYTFTCAFWPVASKRSLDPITAAGAPPIVVIGSTGDPATPYEWAVKLAHQLSSGVLLTRQGEGHTAYGKSRCIDQPVDAYLIDLKVPKDGTVC